LKFRVFLLDYDTEELVRETLISDHEINQRDLGRYLGQIVRITQLSRHIELEVTVVFNGIVTKTDVPRRALLENLFLKYWLNGRVHLLANIFHHYWSTEGNRVFEISQIVGIGELKDLDLTALFHITNPLISLTLRIDKKRPSSSLLINNSIFN